MTNRVVVIGAGGFVGGAIAKEAARGSKLLIVMTPWPEYSRIDLIELRDLLDGNIVIDPHAVFDKDAVTAAGLQWRSLRRKSQ